MSMTGRISINLAGKASFPQQLIYPEGRYTRPSHNRIMAGADILYSEETAELAFDIYRKEDTSGFPYRSERDIAQKNLGASIYFNHSDCLDLQCYLDQFNFWKYLSKLNKDAPNAIKLTSLNPQTNIWESKLTGYYFDYHVIDSFVIIKLDPTNTQTGIPANFKRLITTRYRKKDEITLSKQGMLTLPKEAIAELLNGKPVQNIVQFFQTNRPKCQIDFDPNSRTFTITIGKGDRSIRKDATLKIAPLLKAHGVSIPERLHLTFDQTGNRITFSLDSRAPEQLELRRVQQALGLIR